jgi:hypothetical protein
MPLILKEICVGPNHSGAGRSNRENGEH